QGLVEETGLPKPTLHRMLQQLEAAGMLQRDGDNRQYGTGVRLRRLAENLLLNNTVQGARHAVLRRLVEEVGESCNITALSGNEVLYLDRVETTAPLRFYLHPGSRVPVHCSASGKLFLAQLSPTQRKRLLAHVPLEQ
ncbi:IclR family transcriptional regulator, partial [Staphylococcus aureus]|uniref:IclR family transcriptional regulator n=1 Tax=Staphylococcus aureus TaxID=1280 RepID=UPI00301D3744